MGCRKLEMKKIEDKSSRQVAFSKRRNGLIKKARDISVLCQADVSLVVFSATSKLYEFSSSEKILERYQRTTCAEESTGPSDEMNRFASCGTSSKLLQVIEREMEETNLVQLSFADLVQLENEIDDVQKQIKSRKTQLMLQPIMTLNEEEIKLSEENGRLLAEVAALKNHHEENGATEPNGKRPMLLLF